MPLPYCAALEIPIFMVINFSELPAYSHFVYCQLLFRWLGSALCIIEYSSRFYESERNCSGVMQKIDAKSIIELNSSYHHYCPVFTNIFRASFFSYVSRSITFRNIVKSANYRARTAERESSVKSHIEIISVVPQKFIDNTLYRFHFKEIDLQNTVIRNRRFFVTIQILPGSKR